MQNDYAQAAIIAENDARLATERVAYDSPKGKINGQYVNSILAKREAVLAGFDEAILLDDDGFVAEATGENIFLVKGGALVIGIGFTNSGLALAASDGEATPTSAEPKALDPTELDSWLAVDAKGKVTVFYGKCDMGQGCDVAMAQIVVKSPAGFWNKSAAVPTFTHVVPPSADCCRVAVQAE